MTQNVNTEQERRNSMITSEALEIILKYADDASPNEYTDDAGHAEFHKAYNIVEGLYAREVRNEKES
jgi:hypothetical protein